MKDERRKMKDETLEIISELLLRAARHLEGESSQDSAASKTFEAMIHQYRETESLASQTDELSRKLKIQNKMLKEEIASRFSALKMTQVRTASGCASVANKTKITVAVKEEFSAWLIEHIEDAVDFLLAAPFSQPKVKEFIENSGDIPGLGEYSETTIRITK